MCAMAKSRLAPRAQDVLLLPAEVMALVELKMSMPLLGVGKALPEPIEARHPNRVKVAKAVNRLGHQLDVLYAEQIEV